jgi:anti-anti-sigma factor
LEVEVRSTEEGPVVQLRGEAGIHEASVLEAALLPLVAKRPECVTFDLTQLRFIASLAMGTLVSFRRAAVRAGIRVRLAPGLHSEVREALERARLMELFETVDVHLPRVATAPVAASRQLLYPNVDDVQRLHGITWAELVEREPEVESLLWRARSAGAGCRNIAAVNSAFAPLRNELARLLGFASKHCRHPVLGSIGAFEVAYWKLYDALAGLLPSRVSA